MEPFELIYYDPILSKTITIFNIDNNITNFKGGDDLDFFDIDDNKKIDNVQNNIISDNTSIKSNINVKDIIFFPEDTFYDFKKKVFLIFKKYLNITLYPFLQHIFINFNNPIPLLYRITNLKKTLKITQLQNNKKINGIPIDMELYYLKNDIKIHNKDISFNIDILKKKFNTKKIYVCSLLNYNLNNLPIDILNDSSQLDIIYNSFIKLYFPMINLDIYNSILHNDISIHNVYSELFLDFNLLNSIYKNQTDFLIKKYQHLHNINNKYNDFIKYYNPFLNNDVYSLVKTKISNVKISVKNNCIINLNNLFNLFPLNDNYLIGLKNKNILVKIKKNSNITISSNILTFLKTISNCVIIKKIVDNKEYNIIISNYSIYTVWCNYNNLSMSLLELYKDINDSLLDIIDKINKLSVDIYNSKNQLEILSNNNHIINTIDIKIHFIKDLNDNQYSNIINNIVNDYKILLIKKIDIDTPTSLQFEYSKSVIDIPNNIFDLIDITNTYSYLWDNDVKEKIDTFINKKIFTITKNISNITIILDNFTINDYTFFYQYITYKLYSGLIINNNSNNSNNSNKTIIKSNQKLKYFDPVLLGDDVLPEPYTRLCQKNKRPIAISDLEYKSLNEKEKNEFTKYWNFTSNMPAYYKCNNPKYKDLNFIIKHHPDKYCIPCCKILYTKKGEGQNKKEDIYDSCTKNYKYIENKEEKYSNRYVINYGDIVPPNRIGKIPEDFQNFLQLSKDDNKITSNVMYKEHILMIDPNAESLHDKKYSKYTYSVSNLLKLSTYRKENDVIIDINELIPKHKLEYNNYHIFDIIDNPKLDLILYNKIKKLDPDDFLLVYHNKKYDWKFLIYNKYLVARKYMLYKKSKFTSKVKFITKKQLNKSIIKCDNTMNIHATTKINLSKNKLKLKKYFIYSCNKLYKNIELPYLNIISFCTYISINDLLTKFISYLENNKNIFFKLSKFIQIYYSNCSEYIKDLKIILNENIITLDNINIIDKSFIDLIKYMLNINTVFIITNKSNVNLSINKNIKNLIIDNKINDITNSLYIFIVINKFKNEYINVLTEIVLHDYYKSNKINTTIFNGSNILIDTLYKKIIKSIDIKFNFTFIQNCIKQYNINKNKNDIIINKLFRINNTIDCVELLFKKNKVILPIEESIYDKTDYKEDKYPIRKNITCSYTDIKDIITIINEYIYELSKKNIRLIPDINKFNSIKENSIEPVIDFIKVKNFLCLKIKNVVYYVGVSFNLGYMYFKPISYSKENYNKILNYFKKDYSIMGNDTDLDYYLYYDPDYVNPIISNTKKCNVKYDNYENIFGYELFSKTILDFMYNEKNKNIRKIIKDCITDIYKNKDKWYNINYIIDLFEKELIKKDIKITNDIKDIKDIKDTDCFIKEDIKKISNILKYNIDINTPLISILNIIDNINFEFDNITWKKILNCSSKQKCIDIITKLSNTIIETKQFTINSIDSNYLCSNRNSNYCNKNTLILKNTKNYIELFVNDLFNPIKRLVLEKKILLKYNNLLENNIYKKYDEILYIIKEDNPL